MPFKAPHLGALALAAALATSPAAQAAVTLQSYSLTGATPGRTHTGTFTVAYDDLSDAYSLQDLNLTLFGITFETADVGLEAHPTVPNLYRIGGLLHGVGTTDFGPDFSFVFDPTLTGPQSAGVGVAAAGVGTVGFRAQIERLPSPVPEPSTWAMMIVGFGAAGTLLRKRRARTVAA